jgi:ribonuclease E
VANAPDSGPSHASLIVDPSPGVTLAGVDPTMLPAVVAAPPAVVADPAPVVADAAPVVADPAAAVVGVAPAAVVAAAAVVAEAAVVDELLLLDPHAATPTISPAAHSAVPHRRRPPLVRSAPAARVRCRTIMPVPPFVGEHPSSCLSPSGEHGCRCRYCIAQYSR